MFLATSFVLPSASRSAFVATAGSLLGARPLVPPVSSTTLSMLTSNYVGLSINFFTSIRVPAALIAGSCLATFFTFSDRVKDVEARTRIEAVALIAYHTCAMAALLASLNVIVVSTTTSNALLLGAANPMAESAYAFLIREVPFEFLLTRWSFFMSMFSFLICVGIRSLIEFDLLVRKRWRSAIFIISSIASLMFHLLAFVNQRLNCAPNLWVMTVTVMRMYLDLALSGKSIASLASLISLCTASVAGISLLWRVRQNSQSPLSTLAETLTNGANKTTAPRL
jgi:hypothetical protein